MTIAGWLKTSPMMRLAVFLPTPGRRVSSSIEFGTVQLYSSRSIMHILTMSLALVLYNPQDFIISPTSLAFAFAKSVIDLYFSNNAGVTMFTRLSVHCAERRVAMSSSWGALATSEHCAFG